MSAAPGTDRSHPSAAPPRKVGLVLSSLPPKQQGFGKELVSPRQPAEHDWMR